MEGYSRGNITMPIWWGVLQKCAAGRKRSPWSLGCYGDRGLLRPRHGAFPRLPGCALVKGSCGLAEHVKCYSRTCKGFLKKTI